MYTLPGESFNVHEWVVQKISLANSFRDNAVQQYINQYEKFWDLNISGRTQEQRQSILDSMGSVALEILQDSAVYAGSLITNYPGILPVLYHSSPFDLDFTSEPGRVIIGNMSSAWVGELQSRNS